MVTDTYLSDELAAIGLGATDRPLIARGAPLGGFDASATLATFADARRGDWWQYHGDDGFALGGVTFDCGDVLGCRAAVAGSPPNLTASFVHIPAPPDPIASADAIGMVKGGDETVSIAPDGTISIPLATALRAGLIQPDDVTLKVDADGKLYATAKAARYVVVDGEADRLALASASNLTIAQQVDTSRMWFLNADLDPATAANWVDGGSTSAGVNSFNGRTGIVVPVTGDYLAYIPDYSESRSYGAREAVRRADGLIYLANGAVPSGETFTQGTSGATWRLMIATATSSVTGLMLSTDKAKLDGIATGATAVALATATPAALGTAAIGASARAAREDHVHALPSAATTSAAGLLSASDKTKLDGIASGAAALGSASGAALGTAAAGTAATAARSDHVHPSPSNATTTAAGLMSAADKTKLNGLSSIATMTGATASAAGTSGAVPVPAAGQQNAPLRGDGSYRPLDFLFSRLASNQNVGAGAVMTRVAFSASSTLARGSVTIDPGGGSSFTLKAGRAYWLEFHGAGEVGSGGDTRWCWYDDTGGVTLGTGSIMYPTSGTGNGSHQPVAAAFFLPTVDSVVTCRAMNVTAATTLYYGQSFAKIVEMW
jgi:hypothetical protein